MTSVPKLFSAELDGINAELIEVEADLNVGLHSFNIVGLADKAISEAKERVNSALKHCGIKPPTKENRRITINLAPADIKKVGSRFDLSIALAYLLASEQIKPFATHDKIFVGELSLDGSLRPVSGILSIALLAKRLNISSVFVPEANAREAALVPDVTVIPVHSLKILMSHLEDRSLITPQEPTVLKPGFASSLVHIADIKGQATAKRVLLIAASGGHNVLFSGPPGTGKTMLAQSLISLLPPPTLHESIAITQIYSSAGLNREYPIFNFRPFRAPHHTASPVSIIGGGTNPKPGEISLAHRGVLFLDELPEFQRPVLEGLRQPLETGEVHIARARKALVFPARFMFVAAMNPCPCGYFGDPEKACNCTAHETLRYQKKISGPLLDRIDLQLDVQRVSLEELRSPNPEVIHRVEETQRARVFAAREKQSSRFAAAGYHFSTNADMTSKAVDELITLDDAGERFLKQTIEKSFISARGYYRIIKVAQTIADLESSHRVTVDHLAEAFQYRLKTND